MSRLLATLTLLVAIPSTFAQLAEPKVTTLPQELQAKTKCLNPEFLVYPAKTETNDELPLVIYLHGAGGKGNEIRKIVGQTRALREGIAKFKKGPCIVVAPQCLREAKGERGIWNPEDLNVLLAHLKATLPIDKTRIYLTGNSMGGYGCWVWGGTHPEHFAAIAPVVGGIGRGGPKDVTDKINEWAANLAKVPVYAYAGAKDRVVPAERSERMVAAIKKAGGKQVQIKVYPDEGHNARRLVYTDAKFYDWMFSQKRK